MTFSRALPVIAAKLYIPIRSCLGILTSNYMRYALKCEWWGNSVLTTNVTEQKWSNLQLLVHISSFNHFKIIHEQKIDKHTVKSQYIIYTFECFK